MNVFAISDFHLSVNNPKPMNIFGPVWEGYLESIERSWSENVREDDLVLIAGDLSWAMTLADAVADLDYFRRLGGNKVLIRGNHDYWWKSITAVRSVLPPHTYALQNDAVRMGDVVVCGTRLWTTPEPGRPQAPDDKKIYDREALRLRMSLDAAAKLRREGDRLFVMTHYPPFNSTFRPTIYTDMIAEYAPDAVVYGHLHGSGSRAKREVFVSGVRYLLTSCDLIGNELVPVSVLPNGDDAR